MVKDLSALQILLSSGANPNEREKGTYDEYDDSRIIPYWNGYTPLGFAARHGFFAAAQLLLKHGANPKLARADGALPSDIAKNNGHTKTAEMIKKYKK